MELEIAQKCNAPKGAHEKARTAYRSGYRTRRFGTRLGTRYLLVPKLRNGGMSLSSYPSASAVSKPRSRRHGQRERSAIRQGRSGLRTSLHRRRATSPQGWTGR
ncbi:MAG: transposase [Sphaerochaeta sp.]|uniref:transposase n=1 Tax=Sphaerochaeta sp. TaxID=1972642 RepID=UPI003D12C462